jgi:hypothetical protein
MHIENPDCLYMIPMSVLSDDFVSELGRTRFYNQHYTSFYVLVFEYHSSKNDHDILYSVMQHGEAVDRRTTCRLSEYNALDLLSHIECRDTRKDFLLHLGSCMGV